MLEFEYSTRGRETVPMKYSPERREAILAKLEAPYNRTVNDLAAEEGISTATIYNWRKQARNAGRLLPNASATTEGWSSQQKFNAVLETESPRVLRRLHFLRECSHEQDQQVFP